MGKVAKPVFAQTQQAQAKELELRSLGDAVKGSSTRYEVKLMREEVNCFVASHQWLAGRILCVGSSSRERERGSFPAWHLCLLLPDLL